MGEVLCVSIENNRQNVKKAKKAWQRAKKSQKVHLGLLGISARYKRVRKHSKGDTSP